MLFGQLLLARRCQAVIFGALVGLGLAPFRAHPALLLQAVQRRVERSRFHLEHLGGLRANGLADAIAVLRPPFEGAQNQHPERPLQQIDAAHGTYFTPKGCRLSTALYLCRMARRTTLERSA